MVACLALREHPPSHTQFGNVCDTCHQQHVDRHAGVRLPSSLSSLSPLVCGRAMSLQPSIAVLKEEEQTSTIALEGEVTEWIVGRSLDCPLAIPHTSVSRRHARIFSDLSLIHI